MTQQPPSFRSIEAVGDRARLLGRGKNRARRARFTGRRGSRLLGPIMVLCLTCYDAQNNTDAEQ